LETNYPTLSVLLRDYTRDAAFPLHFFKIYIRKALEWKSKCHGMGVPSENITLYTLQFADDQVVLGRDKEDLEYMIRKLQETYEKWGLDLNLNKTKY
jgi:hypothetical protein